MGAGRANSPLHKRPRGSPGPVQGQGPVMGQGPPPGAAGRGYGRVSSAGAPPPPMGRNNRDRTSMDREMPMGRGSVPPPSAGRGVDRSLAWFIGSLPSTRSFDGEPCNYVSPCEMRTNDRSRVPPRRHHGPLPKYLPRRKWSKRRSQARKPTSNAPSRPRNAVRRIWIYPASPTTWWIPYGRHAAYASYYASWWSVSELRVL